MRAALIASGVVAAIGGMIYVAFVRPTWEAQPARAADLTRHCVERSEELRERKGDSEQARRDFGVDVVWIEHRDGFEAVAFFAGSAEAADRLDADARRANPDAEVDVPADLAAVAARARINRSGAVVVLYRDLPTPDARLAFARCVHSYEHSKWAALFGFDVASLGTPFLDEARRLAAKPQEGFAAELTALHALGDRWGRVSNQVGQLINEAVEDDSSGGGTARATAASSGAARQPGREGGGGVRRADADDRRRQEVAAAVRADDRRATPLLGSAACRSARRPQRLARRR